MKILHTSDWHLGHKLYNYDRADEESHFFRQLAEVVAKERPDVLAISGDVFHTGTPGNDVAKSFVDGLLAVLAMNPGMETFVIAGNHDSYSRLIVARELWSHFHVHVFGLPAAKEDGTADFAGNVVAVGDLGVVAAVPFCHSRNFPVVPDAATEDRQQAYFAGLSKFVAEKAAGRPTVLMAHLAVGHETDFTGQDRDIAVGGEECVEPDVLGEVYDYVALGHIHCPQWVGRGKKRVRYCGTPRAVHFDETYSHGVDIVEVAAGQEPQLRTVPLEPLRRLRTVGGKEGLPFEQALTAVEALDVPAETYVRLVVALGVGESFGPDWVERARQVCAAKGYRYGVVQPVRQEAPQAAETTRKVLTVSELKELSNDKVVEILAGRRSLTEHQRELLSKLVEEVNA